MILNRMAAWLSLSAAVYVSGSVLIQAQDKPDYLVDHSDCTFFGANREKFAHTGLKERQFSRPDQQFRLGALTRVVANALPAREARPMAEAAAQPDLSNTIDLYLFAAMKDAGVTPAEKSTDLEFIRRVTLDLTGRIPTPDRVVSFVADSAPDKRAKLVDELVAKPEWVDKWTMFFGDFIRTQPTPRRSTAIRKAATLLTNGSKTRWRRINPTTRWRPN